MFDYSIMIIDDDETDRYILKRLLKSCGVDAPICERGDGLAALEFLQAGESGEVDFNPFPPTIIFLDINMPRMNGLEFLEQFEKLRAETKNYETVIFMMFTSSNHRDDRQLAANYDFVKGYITKMPGDVTELRTKIAEYVPALAEGSETLAG